MEAIWNESKTFCIELRICADCSCGEEQVWKNSISRYDYVLEQWIFEVTNFRYFCVLRPVRLLFDHYRVLETEMSSCIYAGSF